MPVPVPRVVTPTSHPVIKPARGAVTHPAWRNSKPRRIWEEDLQQLPAQREEQDFHRGLAIADNAMAIKGSRAQAWLPPKATDAVQGFARTAYTIKDEYDEVAEWDERCAAGDVADMMDMDDDDDDDAVDTSPNLVFTDLATYEDQTYRYGAFCPTYDGHSPGSDSGPETGSSPLGPITPFTDFIDRAVATEHPCVAADDLIAIASNVDYGFCKDKVAAEPRQAPIFPTLAETVKESAPAPDVVTPSASSGYRQLVQPLSEWLANYVWRVCTTGLSLSPVFTQPSSRPAHYQAFPPSYLAPSIHSLLLSTLLQPSAIFLGLWYIIRLPGFFNAADLGAEYPKEIKFRSALLGDNGYTYERESLEPNAPFRLVVLGCMLANKWLDDHTFSNKTWNSISNIPIQELNRLEALALDVFNYDLSISNQEWSQWMSHLKSYHMSLAPSQLQPIGRPSSNPHSIIRKSIDEIMQAPSVIDQGPIPQPVFLGIEERKKQRFDEVQSDVHDINLDEDGPLREEYLPKRRTTSGQEIPVIAVAIDNLGDHDTIHVARPAPMQELPPPAKWSPSGDEPILRDRNRSSGHYVAVQPSQVHSYAVGYRAHDIPYNPSWDVPFGIEFKGYATYGYGHPAVPVNPSPYSAYPQPAAISMSHSRSQSLFYDSDNLSSRHHLRSYSQSGFPYKCGDPRMASQEHLAPIRPNQQYAGHYLYPGAAYAPAIAIAPTSWLRV
ncbi:hypothetical protein FA15DRAFT_236766 [Coprinopsis marcescibilis]|uniref:Cyclin N-terminal domain-containing protein n=1 Tax=Coprinopsis marcescibilis TaxID=230819 RepID=A0A5C3L3A1_COPMA|nr:hypothetical protein FA15DRAFT_236766 [Coprinopsis marcescibilis]